MAEIYFLNKEISVMYPVRVPGKLCIAYSSFFYQLNITINQVYMEVFIKIGRAHV